MGAAPLPVPVLAAAAGACPRVAFDASVAVEHLIERQFGGDILAEACKLSGAQAKWERQEAEIARHLAAGGAAVAKTSTGWQALTAEDARGDTLTVSLCDHLGGPERGPLALLVALPEGREPAAPPRADEIVRRMAQMSQDRGSTDGSAALGPVAVDGLRRALAKASQEGLDKWPAAREWLLTLAPDVAGQMLTAAEALRHIASTLPLDRHLSMAIQAAAGNFDVAASFACSVYLLAEAALLWPERSGSMPSPSLDAAHWGAIYEALRQTSYHWRAAAGWLTRELVRIQTAVSSSNG
ncbi:MAG: hypothetical protein H5T86_06540 [Armatimonadetes bacterium]|nr:hypothetical protein [Armatimonadota bacterium]